MATGAEVWLGLEAEAYEAESGPEADGALREKKAEGPRVVRLLIRMVRPVPDPITPPAEAAGEPADTDAEDN